jgi:hypothetical protein
VKTSFVACAGKGYRWGRGRTGEARMVKRQRGYCKGSGQHTPREKVKETSGE